MKGIFGDKEEHDRQLNSFLTAWNTKQEDRDTVIPSLCKRGLSLEEATYQYECETQIKSYMRQNKDEMSVVQASAYFITYATK